MIFAIYDIRYNRCRHFPHIEKLRCKKVKFIQRIIVIGMACVTETPDYIFNEYALTAPQCRIVGHPHQHRDHKG